MFSKNPSNASRFKVGYCTLLPPCDICIFISPLGNSAQSLILLHSLHPVFLLFVSILSYNVLHLLPTGLLPHILVFFACFHWFWTAAVV